MTKHKYGAAPIHGMAAFKKQMQDFVHERDRLMINLILNASSENVDAIRRFYIKNNRDAIPPEDDRVLIAGIYKAAQYCTSIPEDLKKLARDKCVALGFKPTINFTQEADND